MSRDLEITIQGNPEKVAAVKEEIIKELRKLGLEPEEIEEEE